MKVIDINLRKYTFVPGEFVTGQVTLQMDKKLKLRQFFVEFVGIERTRITVSHGKHSHTYTETNYIAYRKKDLWSAGEADPGTYTFSFKFYIPPNALPTHTGTHARVFYQVRARVDVPLWFDVKSQRTLYVCSSRQQYRDPEVDLQVRDPRNLAQYEGKPKPGFHLHLPRSIYYAGQTIDGTITVFNPTSKRIRKVDLFLIGKEYAKARRYERTVTLRKQKRKVDIDYSTIGVPISFSMPIPEDARASYLGKYSQFYWNFKVNLDVAWAFDTSGSADVYILK